VPFIVHSVLPAGYEGLRSTSDENLSARAAAPADRVNASDPAKMHSLAPNLPPHFIKPLSTPVAT